MSPAKDETRIYIYISIYIYIYIYQKEDIYFQTSYVSVSSKPWNTWSLRRFGRNRNITRLEINVKFLRYILTFL